MKRWLAALIDKLIVAGLWPPRETEAVQAERRRREILDKAAEVQAMAELLRKEVEAVWGPRR